MIHIDKEEAKVVLNYTIAFIIAIIFYLVLIAIAAALAVGPLLLMIFLKNGMFLFFYFVTAPVLVKFARYWFADVWTY